ncbi:hypothetical protein Thimo_2416 [Thioflavicoccus mobilis 8321]|uniref:YhaN AAA domain-containing protein n=1 Tax=Thioflavicoccus mobilis 8321 TaxID=765912 RepID=L0GZ90_9GAMM|nr:YhaN family protein [Thioflavicoccus mobilis]AGA91152.1 hypothetical protein Thimo_2416 [Thioflavicoccus mobilis 8321]
MRFERLEIPAYGPFTGFALDLPGEGADFHLIYGPNEAGKSSLLRAIRDLLYGIHAQTPDNFIHDYKDLRIAATIAAGDGRRLSFQRRKGNRNTLLDARGEPLPDDTLAAWLGVVDRDFFTIVFGLGAEELRRGAEALLHGHGELGQALFSASLAGTPVHRILAALEEEARTLFNGRARNNVRIRPAITAYEEAQRASKEAIVRPETWEAVQRALAEAIAERDRLDAELHERRRRRDWLQRCLDALPLLGRLAEQEARRGTLPDLPEVAADFVATTEQALAARAQALTETDRRRARIAQLERRVQDSEPNAAVLAEAAAIEAAHQRLAVYRQWCDELTGLEADCAEAEQRLRAGMRRLGIDGEPESVEALRIQAADELRLEETATALDQAEAAWRENHDEAQQACEALERIDARLGALPDEDVEALRAALTATAGAAEAAKGLPQREAAVAAALAKVERQQGLVAGVADEVAAVCALSVPSAVTLRQYEAERERLQRDRERTVERVAEAEERLRQLAGQRRRLERLGALPTPADLDDARARRDAAWARVRSAWLDGVEAGELDGRPLAEAYPQTVATADQLADRLREEADAVAQAEDLRLQAEEAETARGRAQADMAACEAALADWERRWSTLWAPCGLAPASPVEMLDWRDQWVELCARHEAWRQAADELARARAEVETALGLLRVRLPEIEATTLAELREVAERRVREADAARGARSQLNDQAADQRLDLTRYEAAEPALAAALAEARTAWAEAGAAVGLPALGTAAGLALLAQRRQLVGELDAWNGLRRQIAAKRQAVAEYAAAADAAADRLGLPAGVVEVREAALWAALETARTQRTRRDQAREDLEGEQAQLPTLEQALGDAERRLAEALAAAGVQDEAGLAVLLAHLKERQAIDGEIARLREALHVAARGEPLDVFIERVRAEPADGLAAEAAGLDQAIAAHQAERDRAIEQLASAQAERARLERAGAEAAEHRQEALNIAAGIRQDAARCLRLQLARHLLREQIERFRRESQAPLLARAGELFAAITAGRFEGLGTAFAGDDTPVLVGRRAGRDVAVEAMSDGTRDQLYLALRLAAIERHQRHHEPLPVILDDLLATFDDGRAAAILPILSELGRQSQVLLFTHHGHLVELARAALGADAFHVHPLAAGERG